MELAQHSFKTKVRLDSEFRITMTPEARSDMSIICSNADDKEIGWLAEVQRDGMSFHITKVHLPDQEVGGATTELTTDGLGKFFDRILKENKKDGCDICNAVRFWGHLHPGDFEPSGQDEDTLELFKKNKADYFIRGIVSSSGHMCLTLYLIELGLIVEDVPWEVASEPDKSRLDYWKKEIKKRCKDLYPTVATYGTGKNFSFTPHLDDYDDRSTWGGRGSLETGVRTSKSGKLQDVF